MSSLRLVLSPARRIWRPAMSKGSSTNPRFRSPRACLCDDASVRQRAAQPVATVRLDELPGWELVGAGLADIEAGRETPAAGLVSLASERLATLGLRVPGPVAAEAPERLYALVAADVGPSRAHGRYNALRRRLTSFLHAAERARIG